MVELGIPRHLLPLPLKNTQLIFRLSFCFLGKGGQWGETGEIWRNAQTWDNGGNASATAFSLRRSLALVVRGPYHDITYTYVFPEMAPKL